MRPESDRGSHPLALFPPVSIPDFGYRYFVLMPFSSSAFRLRSARYSYHPPNGDDTVGASPSLPRTAFGALDGIPLAEVTASDSNADIQYKPSNEGQFPSLLVVELGDQQAAPSEDVPVLQRALIAPLVKIRSRFLRRERVQSQVCQLFGKDRHRERRGMCLAEGQIWATKLDGLRPRGPHPFLFGVDQFERIFAAVHVTARVRRVARGLDEVECGRRSSQLYVRIGGNRAAGIGPGSHQPKHDKPS
jgi:hypothetical protein